MCAEDPGSDEFTERISELKAEGANVLVTGTVPDAVHTAVCRDFLGEPGERRRLLVLTDRDPGAVDAMLDPEHGRSPERLRVVDYGDGARSAAGAASTGDPSGVGPGTLGSTGTGGPDTLEDGGIPPEAITSFEDPSLPALGSAITETIDGFETVAGAEGLAPTELRLCLASLGPLVDDYGRSTVFRFLHLLTERVRRARGLAAYHLPVAPTDRSAAMFGSLFDATVELRVEDDRPQQRWDLGDVSSAWLPVDVSG